MSDPAKKPNHLISETSPYLLQHAYNPVDWYPWGTLALDKAISEDKPIILSIGYSSCHWCHVMERESFESGEIAAVMNSRFVCIKVDREERPDVDHVYMDAVQAMGINGGWPLNVFLTPNQKPFYGGTYFPASSWKQLLINVSNTWQNSRKEVNGSADKLTALLARSETAKYELYPDEANFELSNITGPAERIAANFDPVCGGMMRAPKFPMPVLWKFILNSGFHGQNKSLTDHVMLTLEKMAKGGIFDQVGGGFARYSVDETWFAPHFEKMLYDNAQLMNLYTLAYRFNPDSLFREVVYLTVEFIERELTAVTGGFYAALDADSGGEEGKYYVWKEEEIDKIIHKDQQLIKEYWGVTTEGNWEHGNNILFVARENKFIIDNYNISENDLAGIISNSRESLLNHRNSRVRPGLDNKILTSWNAMMITGLANAWITFGEKKFLDMAVNNAVKIAGLINDKAELPRSIHKPDQIPVGYLDDYAFLIEAYISIYQAVFDEKWLRLADKLADYVLRNFYDAPGDFFYYTSEHTHILIARKQEIFDNVIPGSNSVMAMNYFILGKMLDKESYLEVAVNMLRRIQNMLMAEPEYLSNWGNLYFLMCNPFAEIIIVGPEYREFSVGFGRQFNQGKIIMASEHPGSLPLFNGKTAINGKTTIYVCYNKTCKLPVHSVEDALRLLK